MYCIFFPTKVKYKEAYEMTKAKCYSLHPEGVNFVNSRKAHKICNDVTTLSYDHVSADISFQLIKKKNISILSFSTVAPVSGGLPQTKRQNPHDLWHSRHQTSQDEPGSPEWRMGFSPPFFNFVVFLFYFILMVYAFIFPAVVQREIQQHPRPADLPSYHAPTDALLPRQRNHQRGEWLIDTHNKLVSGRSCFCPRRPMILLAFSWNTKRIWCGWEAWAASCMTLQRWSTCATLPNRGYERTLKVFGTCFCVTALNAFQLCL